MAGIEGQGEDFVGGGELGGDGGEGGGVDGDAFKVDDLESLLGGEGDVEIVFLDSAHVDEDSTEGAAFFLLEIKGFGVLLAGDAAHFLEDAAEGAAFQFGDGRHSGGLTAGGWAGRISARWWSGTFARGSDRGGDGGFAVSVATGDGPGGLCGWVEPGAGIRVTGIWRGGAGRGWGRGGLWIGRRL